MQVEKDQKNADRLAEEQMKQAQEMVFDAQTFARTIRISICWVDFVETGIFSIQSIFTAYIHVLRFMSLENNSGLKQPLNEGLSKKVFLKRIRMIYIIKVFGM